MDDWLRHAADALGVDALDDEAQRRLLAVARDVAHGVERRLTPVATFLLGVAVERRMAAGEDRATALGHAIAELERAIDAAHDA